MKLTTPLASLLLPLLPLAQMTPDISICQYSLGENFADACCETVLSRGPDAPCPHPHYVSNLTDCTKEAYPTGWAACIEQDPEDPEKGPQFMFIASGEWTSDMAGMKAVMEAKIHGV